MSDKPKCEGSVPDGGRSVGFHLCGNNASVQRDGKWYCKTHDPKPAGTGEFIYGVDDNFGYRPIDVDSCEIQSESDKRIVLVKSARFTGHKTHLNKATFTVYRSPTEAVDAYVEMCRNRVSGAEKRLTQAKDALSAAIELKESL
jgi:hypothetical protein